MSGDALRVAWCSPWPPQKTGVAGRSAEIVPLLASRGHAIDVFVDAAAVPVQARLADAAPAAGAIRVISAHDLLWRRRRGHYDIAVYQIGNSRAHGFVWPYLLQWPGLVVLHDARLHHARAVSLLTTAQADAYRHEFAWSHPDVSIDAAELAVNGFDGTYYHQWPMRRAILEAARVVAVHSRGVIDELRAEAPDAQIEYLPLGEGRDAPIDDATRARRRGGIGAEASHIVFGVFGALTADKRIPEILRAFAVTHARHPHTRLLLAGTADPSLQIEDRIRQLHIAEAVAHVADADDAGFDELIAAVDVCVALRWPTALETSGPWLRALAAARATIVTELAHQAHLPMLDPRTWLPHGPAMDQAMPPRAIAVSIDLADEEHSLRVAMDRLVWDAALRVDLGRAGRRYWDREHRVSSMLDAYDRLLATTAQRTDPPRTAVGHVRPDAWTHTRGILHPYRVGHFDLWTSS
jgi:glycosyltransferase involved in cell wall biosynthesis